MEEQYITFETAKLAKEKGCKNFLGLTPLAFDCTQASLQKWLREVHNIHIELQFDTISYGYRIFNPFKSEDYFTDWRYKTWKYEECLEEALQEALKLI